MHTKKEMKKREKKQKEEMLNTLEMNVNVKIAIINFLVVLIVFGTFYYITTLITKGNDKLNTVEKEKIPTTIQYDEITAGETFNKPEKEYYVLFYDFEGPNAIYYKTIIKELDKKIYIVDLSKKFNSNFIQEPTNKNVQKSKDLKVKEDTLIKIKDNKNINYFEGKLTEIKEEIQK